MDWFRHDLSAQQDIKIKKLIRKYGYEGYGLYWHAVELLFNNGGTMKINDFEEEFEFISQNSFPGYLEEIGLIGIEGDFYTSSRIQEELKLSNERIERFKSMGRASAESRRNKSLTQDECMLNVGSAQVERKLNASSTYVEHIQTNIHTNKHTKKETPKGVKKESIAKPTLQEISDYCIERLNGIDAQMFFDFYQAKGWKIGNAPMKDWKACVRTWESRNNKPLPKSRICNNAEAMKADMNATGGFDL